jgi:tripartite ATP-independent transporter DctM subunit
MSATLMVVFLVTLVLGVPIAFTLLVAGLAAVWVKGSLPPLVAVQQMFAGLDSFPLMAIPFFILAAELMTGGALTEVLLRFASQLIGHVRGGLGHANVLASMFFAGMSGSATADAVGLGQIEIRAMEAEGYDKRFSVGVTAASALLSPIIPPSIVLVAYAVQAQVSVAAMFFAAIVPGLLMAGCFMAWVAVSARRLGFPKGAVASLGELWRGFRGSILALMTPAIILVGIYTGLFTPTEAAAVAALYALIVTVFVYREVGWGRVLAELRGTLMDTAVIMLIIAFTSTLGVVLIRSGVPTALAQFLASLTSSPSLLLMLLLVLWLIVGCFMAQTPAILILTPILLPIADTFGVNQVHFGIVMALALTIGLLTPPVGMVLYALVRVTRFPFGELVRVSYPYVLMLVALTIVLILFPTLTLFLPRLLGYADAN